MSAPALMCILLELTIAIASAVDGADRYFSGKVGWASVYWIVSACALGAAAFIYLDARRSIPPPQKDRK